MSPILEMYWCFISIFTWDRQENGSHSSHLLWLVHIWCVSNHHLSNFILASAMKCAKKYIRLHYPMHDFIRLSCLHRALAHLYALVKYPCDLHSLHRALISIGQPREETVLIIAISIVWSYKIHSIPCCTILIRDIINLMHAMIEWSHNLTSIWT